MLFEFLPDIYRIKVWRILGKCTKLNYSEKKASSFLESNFLSIFKCTSLHCTYQCTYIPSTICEIDCLVTIRYHGIPIKACHRILKVQAKKTPTINMNRINAAIFLKYFPQDFCFPFKDKEKFKQNSVKLIQIISWLLAKLSAPLSTEELI